MPTRLKTDASVLHKRLALILATEIRNIRNKQLRNKARGISDADTRKLKRLTDMLDRQIRTRRMLEADVNKALDKLPDEQLEKLAAGAPATPPEPGEVPPLPPAKTPAKPRRSRKGARS